MSLSLINRTPEPDETQVPIDTLIYVDITNTGAGSVDDSETQVYIEDVLAYNGGVFQSGFDGPGSTSGIVTDHTRRITIDPTTDFESLQEVTVRVVSESVGGTFTIDESYTFICEDLTTPVILSVIGSALNQVDVVFDEAVDEATALTISNYTISRLAMSAPSVAVEVIAVDQLTASSYRLTANINLTHDVAYQLTVENVEDLFGNVIDAGDGTVVFQSYIPSVPENRDFRIWFMLPRMNREEDETGDLRKTVAVVQEVTEQMLFSIDEWTIILDPDKAPEPFVDAMLRDMGNPFSFPLVLIDKRRLLRVLVAIYRQKGTAKGIKNAVRFFLGFELEITDYAEDTLILGESELGYNWILGVSNERAAYTFMIELDFNPTNEQRLRLLSIVDYMKPAHTHLGGIIEPEEPGLYDHWELGISELGETTLLH